MTKLLSLLFVLATAPAYGAAVLVIDPAVLTQVIQQVLTASNQLQQLQIELERLGNPAAVALETARALQHQLSQIGAGRTLEEVQRAASGTEALHYDANGLYHPPGETIRTADGRETPRQAERYRKFDAITQATKTLEDVMRDTQERRQAVRQQVQQTLGQLQAAPDMATVAKLSAVLTAQNAELSAIDREREAALSRVLVVHIENQTDAARQDQARRENRAAAYRAASSRLGDYLTPAKPVTPIADPRQTGN